jgi:hypothetical protein
LGQCPFTNWIGLFEPSKSWPSLYWVIFFNGVLFNSSESIIKYNLTIYISDPKMGIDEFVGDRGHKLSLSHDWKKLTFMVHLKILHHLRIKTKSNLYTIFIFLHGFIQRVAFYKEQNRHTCSSKHTILQNVVWRRIWLCNTFYCQCRQCIGNQNI